MLFFKKITQSSPPPGAGGLGGLQKGGGFKGGEGGFKNQGVCICDEILIWVYGGANIFFSGGGEER